MLATQATQTAGIARQLSGWAGIWRDEAWEEVSLKEYSGIIQTQAHGNHAKIKEKTLRTILFRFLHESLGQTRNHKKSVVSIPQI
ncbi:hypothetical protein [Kerstersia gyiorum]|uniref:hypothetical protein n=1 Tax=Kerstersia gyiorum TaxID=206506 RepID=UPI0013EEE200|nr:hypothetical protein [Kerstersia gyiorum]MCP1634983.1 hypothetical protein [Kerstersia gyiorum]MCP1670090.1 hypothetical protein [Kerstersia gyiorum]MCP1707995.1 hypothetical protein [Kerstersia gyiorum]MCP1711305.1 hypothetical protein [Kerstersia gyiorum]MCR4160514.1 hypothetical protein [Kerstersia gyiorum]